MITEYTIMNTIKYTPHHEPASKHIYGTYEHESGGNVFTLDPRLRHCVKFASARRYHELNARLVMTTNELCIQFAWFCRIYIL